MEEMKKIHEEKNILLEDYNAIKKEYEKLKDENIKEKEELINKESKEKSKLNKRLSKLNKELNNEILYFSKLENIEEENNKIKEDNDLLKEEINKKNEELEIINKTLIELREENSKLKENNINENDFKFYKDSFNKLTLENIRLMDEYNNVVMELKLFKSNNLDYNKIKDYYENFKKELNDYKTKCKNLEEENQKLKEEQKKEKEEKNNNSKKLTIIDLSKQNPINEKQDLNNIRIRSKTIKNEGISGNSKGFESITQENRPKNNSKLKEIGKKFKKSVHFGDTPLRKVSDIFEEESENRPDSEFLRKIRMYSNNKEKIESKLRKSQSEIINKKLFQGISSADKKENTKEEKMENGIKILKKSRGTNSEEKDNKEKLFKSTKIKRMASLLEEEINKNLDMEKNEKIEKIVKEEKEKNESVSNNNIL